jgi:hypothetical protein
MSCCAAGIRQAGPIAPKLEDCRSRGAVHAPTEQIDLEQAGASSERRSCFFLDLPTAIILLAQ